jgi:hypothetical protein
MVLFCPDRTRAAPFIVTLDPNQSTLTMELCLSGKCDTETSPVTGYFTIELDCVDFPADVTLYDFRAHLTNTLHFTLSWGFLGALNATGSNISTYYAYPGVALGPVPVMVSAFDFAGVAGLKEGLLSYTATGVPCALLQAVGKPCTDTHDLAADPPSSSDWTGTLTTANRYVTLVSTIDETQPLDPNNPTLGTLHTTGTVRGTAFVARPPGDVDGDGDADLADFALLQRALPA